MAKAKTAAKEAGDTEFEYNATFIGYVTRVNGIHGVFTYTKNGRKFHIEVTCSEEKGAPSAADSESPTAVFTMWDTAGKASFLLTIYLKSTLLLSFSEVYILLLF